MNKLKIAASPDSLRDRMLGGNRGCSHWGARVHGHWEYVPLCAWPDAFGKPGLGQYMKCPVDKEEEMGEEEKD